MNDNEVEYINALTPFDHGVWQGKTSDGELIKVGDKALFTQRSEWLVDRIVNYLTNEFTQDALRSMSVLEVGSYDGWVLTQVCSRIEFSEAIGVEPRHKNIKKGEVGRKLAGLETQAKFIQGSASDLADLFPDRVFDLVVCLGMLHHVSSTFDTVASLCAKASKACIIDSMIIPELEDDAPKIAPFVNTRDIVYQGEEGLWSIAAFKYESPYGDGSRPDYGIVNIPSARLIEMSLRSCGFGTVQPLGDETDFFDDSGQKLRGVKETLCVSKREISHEDLSTKWMAKVHASEDVFCHTVLPVEIISALSCVSPLFDDLDIADDVSSAVDEETSANLQMAVSKIVIGGVDEETKNILLATTSDFNEQHLQILTVLFRSPYEKAILEIAKFFLSKSVPDLATKYLQLIVRQPGCDWWSFYRSCYILRQSFEKLGEAERSAHYQELLTLSNENFPF